MGTCADDVGESSDGCDESVAFVSIGFMTLLLLSFQLTMVLRSCLVIAGCYAGTDFRPGMVD